jgi:FkbM family methyltransferase
MNVNEKILQIYTILFGRKIFIKLNRFFFHAGLRGLGILNFKDVDVTKDEVIWLNSYISKLQKPVIFDVGANKGSYSREVFRLNEFSQIYAFEPSPTTFKKLKSNLQGNHNLFNVGLGSSNSKMKLFDYLDEDSSSHASLYQNVIEDLHGRKSLSHEVDIITLDDFVESNSILSIDLLKIDTEGHEFEVLQGAINSIKKNVIKTIHFEFNEMNIISKKSFKDFWDLLENYEIYRILFDGSLMKLREYSPINCELYAYQNIIAIQK